MLTIALTSKTITRGALHVRKLVGREALSEPFELVVDVETTDRQADPIAAAPHALLDATVEIAFVDASADAGSTSIDRGHVVSGVVRHVQSEAPSIETDPLRHRLVVVPHLWRATQGSRSRIVRKKQLETIVAELLAEDDPTFDATKDLDATRVTRAARDGLVQYEESTFDFLSRLLEDEGVGYRFAHVDGQEHEQLVLFDGDEPSREKVEVDYAPGDHPNASKPAIHALRRRLSPTPRAVRVLDWNPRHPELPTVGEASALLGARLRAVGVVSTTRERLVDVADAKRRAAWRMQEAVCARDRFEGRSSRHQMRPGDRIVVKSTPFGDLALLVVEVEHDVTFDARAGAPSGYSNAFVAIDARHPFRPARRTPRPRIHGVMVGVVDGPSPGVAAPIDDEGSYQVRLFFAPNDLTPWIRRVQPLAGASSGMHLPLRAGAEVAIAFVDGDPDRPVILGAVPNALTGSLVVKSNATQSVIQTISGARIEIEDNA